jgi:hypothetical protein
VYYAPGKSWFVFHGTGHWPDKVGPEGLANDLTAWRQSSDGVHFSPLRLAFGGTGHTSSCDVLLLGNHIYVLADRLHYWAWKGGSLLDDYAKRLDIANLKGPAFYKPYEIYQFEISGNVLSKTPVEGEAIPGHAHIGLIGPEYGSLTRDSKGRFWVAARVPGGKGGPVATWVARSRRPEDIREWERHTVLFTSPVNGTHAPQIIALDEGRVACVLFVQQEEMTMAFLYNPTSGAWGKPYMLGKGTQSKRSSAVFDPGSRRLHVIYTDEAGAARHRSLAAPYALENWSPSLDKPGTLVATQAGTNPGDDDLSLSADLSRKPAPLALVHRGPDQHLHLKYYDGKDWSSKDVKVGLQDPIMSCDEVSAVADFSHGLGFSYYCTWKEGTDRVAHDYRGQVRFGLAKNVAGLFSGK